jgi:hypothetical protein
LAHVLPAVSRGVHSSGGGDSRKDGEEGAVMTYYEIYEIISDFCPRETLEMFADGWERFPSEPNASKIVKQLKNERDFWQERRPDRAEKMQRAIDEIKGRLAQ